MELEDPVLLALQRVGEGKLADREAIERLMLERRQINEMRLSLDRRRDQTRLLTSHRR